ncbi:MAG: DEAD/DEAH box helicase [Armatimonadetes bacterium]|nr:DEAD/DEAH box helicase [Armatimonadota bacterium]
MVEPRRIGELLGGRPVHAAIIPAQDGRCEKIPDCVPFVIQDWLAAQGITSLYSHQAESARLAAQGRDLMVVTGTGSGKSLCYTLPALKACLEEPAARCLFLFPTKALAQDQLGKLQKLIPGDHVLAATYDGDTERAHRSAIRRQANIVLSNPDMVHLAMLPGHENWLRFLKNLRLVVIDEAHVYRGAFGGHMGWILRRLLRLCAWHGNRPQLIACSATVANPTEHFSTLTGREPHLVAGDGAPQGERQIVVVEAPGDEAAEIKSPTVECAGILAEAVTNGVKTMVFCRSRNGVELLLRAARQELGNVGGDPAWIDAYRGGYTPDERREIERRLFGGSLRGVAATNAMELGVDIGGLDLVVMNGYPGSRSSFWQQSGRAGRAGRSGMALMLAHADPMEQYLARRINLLVGEPEPCVASVGNPLIAARQLKCAAAERPLTWSEIDSYGARPAAQDLIDSGELAESAGMLFYPAFTPPSREFSIRSADLDSVPLFAAGVSLGDMEEWRAMQFAHTGAVHLHRGESYIVTGRSGDGKAIQCDQFDGDYHTQPIVQSLIEPRAELEAESRNGLKLSLQAVSATTLVTGYRMISSRGSEILAEVPLDPASRTMDTVAMRISFELGADFGIGPSPEAAAPGIHALEHVLAAVAPLIAGCDRRDIGSSWFVAAPDTLSPTVYLYDLAPGGLGFSEQLFRQRVGLVMQAAQLLSLCGCRDGCPLCTLSPHCESRNECLSKPMVAGLLRTIASRLGHTG